MVRPGAAFRQDRNDVFERLPNLRDKPVGEPTRDIPADDTTRHNETSIGHDAVGISLRLRPAAGLKHLQAARRGGF